MPDFRLNVSNKTIPTLMASPSTISMGGTDTMFLLQNNSVFQTTWNTVMKPIINFSKGQVISSIYSIVDPTTSSVSNVKAFWLFDKYEDTDEYLTDRGPNAHSLVLRNSSLVTITADTCSPGIEGICYYLNFDSSHTFDTDDSIDFSFSSPVTPDFPFSIVALVNPTTITVGNDSIIFAKRDETTGDENEEYQFYIDSGGYLSFKAIDNSTGDYIGRKYNTDILSDLNTWNTYIVTKSEDTTSASIKLYRNGVKVDNTSLISGTYSCMIDTTAKPSNYAINSAGNICNFGNYKYGLLLIVAEELMQVQVTQIDYILRSYIGKSLN